MYPYNKTGKHKARFEIPAMVSMNTVFWSVTPWNLAERPLCFERNVKPESSDKSASSVFKEDGDIRMRISVESEYVSPKSR